MREQFLSNTSARQAMLRITAIAFLLASLMIGTAWPMPVSGQVISQGTPPTGMGATSPLAARSNQPAGIPLGATEITKPGISPVFPSQGQGMTACTGSGSTSSSTSLFDGGGLSRNALLSCADSQIPSSPLPSSSSAGRVGIPLGATELGGAGISAVAPVTGPNPPDSSSSSNNPGNP